LHVRYPVVFKLLQRHFTVTIRIKGSEYSGRIVTRHVHVQMSQKSFELVSVDKSWSENVVSHNLPLREMRGATGWLEGLMTNKAMPLSYLSLSNFLNATRAVSCWSATESRREDAAADDPWATGREGLGSPNGLGLSNWDNALDKFSWSDEPDIPERFAACHSRTRRSPTHRCPGANHLEDFEEEAIHLQWLQEETMLIDSWRNCGNKGAGF
jgi:hypothetical protein